MLFNKIYSVLNSLIFKKKSNDIKTIKLTFSNIPNANKTIPLITNPNNFTYYTSIFVNSIKWVYEEIFFYIKGITFNSNLVSLYAFILVLAIDSALTDDEPLWEPVEWSLVQSWILFIFSFAWIAENLIVSRYGSYTGRDKRVWLGWFKTYWMIELFYALNYGAASVFVITPFYNEVTYSLYFVYSWWNWFSRVFFFKFSALFVFMLLLGYYMQIRSRWLNWKKMLIITLTIVVILAYTIYTQFVILFFGYLTDPIWFQKSRPVDYVQLSHEPLKWGSGNSKRDHFSYHSVRTVFWFKNDGPFAASFLLFHFFFFICLFTLFIYWISLFRRIYSTKEVPTTFLTYCVSSLKHFINFFLLFYVMVFMSFMVNYMRLPYEYSFALENISWISNFIDILWDYPLFLLNIFL